MASPPPGDSDLHLPRGCGRGGYVPPVMFYVAVHPPKRARPNCPLFPPPVAQLELTEEMAGEDVFVSLVLYDAKNTRPAYSVSELLGDDYAKCPLRLSEYVPDADKPDERPFGNSRMAFFDFDSVVITEPGDYYLALCLYKDPVDGPTTDLAVDFTWAFSVDASAAPEKPSTSPSSSSPSSSSSSSPSSPGAIQLTGSPIKSIRPSRESSKP